MPQFFLNFIDDCISVPSYAYADLVNVMTFATNLNEFHCPLTGTRDNKQTFDPFEHYPHILDLSEYVAGDKIFSFTAFGVPDVFALHQ